MPDEAAAEADFSARFTPKLAAARRDDLYACLGLEHLRYEATADQIRRACLSARG